MKRFLLFESSNLNLKGGFDDFTYHGDSVDDLVLIAENNGSEWFHILDTKEMIIVRRYQHG